MAITEKYMRSIIIFLIVGYIAGQNTCFNLVTDGYTEPHGDIVKTFGDSLTITCNLHKRVIDEYGANASSRLFFERNNAPIPQEMIEIISPSSIRLHIEEHPKTEGDNYYCYFNATTAKKMICMNVVIFGVAPQNVTDFSCISRNYENLTCTWTAPQNYVMTNYNLTYYLKQRSSRKYGTKGNCQPPSEAYDGFIYNCSIEKLDNNLMRCFWNVSTIPQYRPVHECYYFTIAMNNSFGSNVNHFIFEHFKHVVPGPPENLTAVATSPHSINLSWVIPFSMISFKPGLHHRILYQCEYYEKIWQFGGYITNTRNKTLSYELKGLKYAHALCDIRVSMISAKADSSNQSLWSENATRTVRTESKLPDCPPKTNLGSFEIIDNNVNRDVYVYWQQLREEQKNGQNLSYIIEVQNHSAIRPFDSTKTYVLFKNLYYIDYVVNIWSINEKGRSTEKSTVVIPSNRLAEPLNFIRVAHSKNIFELSWEPPKQSRSIITNYTIFWCLDENDRPFQCIGNLNWTVVPKDVRKYNQTLPKNAVYQFAISANSLDSSSGMTWAECTIIPNRTMGKIKSVEIPRVGSDFIDVKWKLDCSNRLDSIKGFIIYYCPMKSPVQTSCEKTTEKNVTIKGDAQVQSGTITGLKPYTSYRIAVGYIVTHDTYSQTSESTINTTSEAAPATPPLNVEVYNITNSSISLKWQPPTQANGMLKYYIIYYNDKEVQVTKNEMTLTDLLSFENYSISIKACTVHCSSKSETLHVVTKMWLPGVIKQPIIKSEKDSYITIVWDRPNPPRGEVNYYQLKVTQRLDSDELMGPTINVTTQNYTTESCASGKYKALFVSVRAINIINGEHITGPWSDALESSCNTYTSVLYMVVGSLIIFFCIAMAYASKKVYEWWAGLEPIIPKLPPGLQADVEIWDSGKPKDIDSNPPDAEQLLKKMIETSISRESSGCSSGHESITSSLGSTAHISPSDSGTEQPRSPSLSEENRKHSLRQRNVSAPRPTINTGYVTADAIPSANWASKPSTTSPGNYCILGVDPSNTEISDPPYVPVSMDMSQPPPYVMTGDLVKSTNPGYVPYSASETPEKNMGYVVAGLPKDLLSSDLLQYDAPKSTIIEEKPLYMRAAESIPTLKPQYPWPQPLPQPTLPKTGYVSVGDAPPPPKCVTEVTKGYVPHRQFEAKSLKED